MSEEFEKMIKREQRFRSGAMREPEISNVGGDWTSPGAEAQLDPDGDSSVRTTTIENGDQLAKIILKALEIVNLGMPLPDFIQIDDSVVTKTDLQRYLSQAPASRG